MAERRMFARSILLFGAFLELSRSAQVLYILLNMQADDDGLVGNVIPQLRLARCTKRHLQGCCWNFPVALWPSPTD